MAEKVNVEEIMDDEICHKWIVYSMAGDEKKPADWYREKQSYWEKNSVYLEGKGFTYGSNVGNALDEISLMKQEELEGSLLVVKIGNKKRTATPDDIKLAYKMLKEVLEGVKGVRVIVVHHAFDVTQISLPQLRNLQSAVLASTDPDEDVNPIYELDL